MTSGQHLFSYATLEYMIFIEIICVILIVIFCYLMYAYYRSRSAHTQKRQSVIQNTIKSNLQSKKPLSLTSFKERDYELSYFIPVISNLYTDENKNNLKVVLCDIFDERLLPLARKHYKSRSWMKRFYAAHTFFYKPTPADLEHMSKLIKDGTTLISLYAMKACISLGTSIAIERVILQISTHRKLSESIFIQCFESADASTKQHVLELLAKSSEPYVKACCYRCLAMYPDKQASQARQDVFSEHKELRLEAIRMLQYNPESQDLLLKLFDSKDWESRCQAIKSLSKLKLADTARYFEKMLQDEAWWVRFDAAKVLKNFGPNGISILQRQKPDNKLAHQISQFVLQEQRIRGPRT